MNIPVTLTRIDSSQDPRFAALDRIFRDGFDRRERGDDKRLAGFLDDRFYRVVAAVDSEGQVAGMAALMLPESSSLIWLEYMAVLPVCQSCGIGTQIMTKLQENNADYEGILFEVHIPHETEDAAERETRLRRILFYTRLGCVLLAHMPYRMWTTDGGLPVYLIYAGCRGVRPLSGKTLDNAARISIRQRRDEYRMWFRNNSTQE